MADLSSDNDEELALSALKARIKSNGKKKRAPPPQELSSSDDEDDKADNLMLSSMKKKVVRAVAKAKAKRNTVKAFKAERSAVKRSAPSKKKARVAKKSSRATPVNDDDSYLDLFRSKSFKVNAVVKSHLVEGILIRWKYAIDWPPRSAIMAEPPKGFIMLRGYKGVYVGIHGEHCGKIIDNRADTSDIPSYDNLMRKSPAVLKSMLEKAIQRQAIELEDNDGPQRLHNDLNMELRNLAKVNVNKLSEH